MATKKISELSALTSVASDDLLAIVDTSGTETMKITSANFLLPLYELLGIETDTWDESTTYSTDDIVVYNYKLYKNLTGTNTSTTPDSDTTNWEETSILVS